MHTDRYLGVYLPTTYEAVRAIANDTEHFSSRRIVVRSERAAPENLRPAPPITSDPPYHKPAKQLLLPPFTPDAMKKLEPRARAICNELIDKFINDKSVDAAAHYSKHIPVRVIAHMLGIPEDDGHLFIRWIHEILELGVHDQQTLVRPKEMRDTSWSCRGAEAPDRRPHQRHVECQDQDGEPLSGDHASVAALLLIAGIDTT